jgi:hypothetical protein
MCRPDRDGYYILSIKINGTRRNVRLHVLIWFAAFGEWIPGAVDHINRIRNDNRLINFRRANQSQNRANSTVSRRNKARAKGVVTLKKGRKPYWATIYVRGRKFDLGYHNTVAEASAAYEAAAVKYFGEFATAGMPENG